MVQVFLKKWWVESDFKVPNLPLSLWLKVSGCETAVYNILLSRSAQEVKPLCRILHCHDSSTMWNRRTHHCTVTTPTLCETAVHSIVLLRLIHYVKLLCWIFHCHISHKIWNCRAFYCTFTMYRMLFNLAAHKMWNFCSQ